MADASIHGIRPTEVNTGIRRTPPVPESTPVDRQERTNRAVESGDKAKVAGTHSPASGISPLEQNLPIAILRDARLSRAEWAWRRLLTDYLRNLPGEAKTGQAPAGHILAGQVPTGKVPAGQVPAGQVPAGQVPAGQVPAGQVPAGQVPAGQVPAGQVPAGQVPAGQVPAGQVPAGQVPAGQVPAGQVPAGQVRAGQVPAGQVPAGQVPAGQVPSGQVPSGQVPSGQVPSGQVPAGQVPAGQVPAGQVPAVAESAVRVLWQALSELATNGNVAHNHVNVPFEAAQKLTSASPGSVVSFSTIQSEADVRQFPADLQKWVLEDRFVSVTRESDAPFVGAGIYFPQPLEHGQSQRGVRWEAERHTRVSTGNQLMHRLVLQVTYDHEPVHILLVCTGQMVAAHFGTNHSGLRQRLEQSSDLASHALNRIGWQMERWSVSDLSEEGQVNKA